MPDELAEPNSGFIVRVTTLRLEDHQPMLTDFVVAESDPAKAEQIMKAVTAPNEQVNAVCSVSADRMKAFGLKPGDFIHVPPAQ